MGEPLPDGGRVSHVLYCYPPDRLDEAIAFWEALGVGFDEIDLPGAGLRVLYSRESGIELLAPTDDRPSAYRRFVDESGGGIYGIVHRVPDLDAASERATSAGVPVERHLSYTGREPWSHTYDALDEAILAEHLGMRVTLARIELKDGS